MPPDDDPILDEAKVDELRDILGDGPDGVDGLVETFLDGAPELMDELTQAARDGDLEQVDFLAHKIKGEAATLGATRLAGQAEALEDGAREEELADPEGAVEELRETYEATEEAFQSRAPGTE